MLEVYFVTEENREIVVIDETTMKSKIYYIRNQKVMLDFELAEIYGYETKTFNPVSYTHLTLPTTERV